MRPSILYPLFAPIEVLKGIGDKYAKLVKNLCGEKVIDVLFHLPVSVAASSTSRRRRANIRIGFTVRTARRSLYWYFLRCMLIRW